MPGRPPTPVSVLRVRGTFQPSRHANRTTPPEACGEIGDPPAHFTEAQKKIWLDAVRDAPQGVLRHIDREILTVWVEAVDRHRKAMIAQSRVDQDSEHPLLTRDSRGGLIASPYLRIMNQAADLVLRFGAEMGFSPTSRTRLASTTAPQTPKPPDDAWAMLKRLQACQSARKRDPLSASNRDPSGPFVLRC